MIKAAVISNGLEGLHHQFNSIEEVNYDILTIDAHFDPDLDLYDVLVVPNGSDHIALFKIKDKIKSFLDQGKALICVDGWFTRWIPGNQWIMDNTKKTIDVRYKIKNDRYGIFEDVDINSFIYSHGISGWWACGYIDAAPEADIVVEDTWNRPIIVLDEHTTNGLIFMTASGPLADATGQTTDDKSSMSDLPKLFKNVIKLIASKKQEKELPLTT
ncbi:hypothetical protein BST97_12815 [Nonlabens spongiae]|uniref:Uncharacterized protein n=1 Tax=Nonlabens spongiae TaxID=331648 RepID=A0A1W6MMH5_9FLAO|nr:hypothetical protein [Nonlabens spongiae]ARN78800.1 hypothetical protein BST97_12815 [Nonlabens spongiae]